MTKTALITGGNSGIGKATAILFAQRGYQVAIAARRITLLEKVAHAITEIGGTSVAIAADVSVAADVDEMVNSALSQGCLAQRQCRYDTLN